MSVHPYCKCRRLYIYIYMCLKSLHEHFGFIFFCHPGVTGTFFTFLTFPFVYCKRIAFIHIHWIVGPSYGFVYTIYKTLFTLGNVQLSNYPSNGEMIHQTKCIINVKSSLLTKKIIIAINFCHKLQSIPLNKIIF